MHGSEHEKTTRSPFLRRHGEWTRITPAEAGWRYLAFAVERLPPGGRFEQSLDDEETAIVLVEGACTAVVDGRRFELGPRSSVFEALPWTLYVPRGAHVAVESTGGAELAVASAPCERRLEPVLQTPDEVGIEVRGAGNATRQITNQIQPGFPAERILVCEVLTPSGNWSSYPPHKHDESRAPEEVTLEEIYYYRAPSPDAFGVQRLYTAAGDLDETVVVRDGDAFLIPRGYHPFVAGHGYDFYYLCVLAGDEHSMAAADDPALAWVRGAWSDLDLDPRVPLVGGGATR